MARSLDELINNLQSKVQQVMETTIADEISSKLISHAQTDVYDVYEPKKYQRTKSLTNYNNIKVEKIKNGIKVSNISEHDGKYIPYVVEYADGYDFTGYGYAYEEPRPFVENTREELIRENTIIQLLKKGLKEQGIKVK